ncbi:cytochrome P450 [Pseudoroseomonas cervicalis]|uniref:cytochrome P450 n=1 Tax=Teichococcus cervicalis TaxID=204525 RepID=UPI0022F17251|nr:cytochrome P450 [Pseudoroseomonas cervicalis]WBV44034.1 cytochrome P450 [Pseudoroseomonas cervicalis]
MSAAVMGGGVTGGGAASAALTDPDAPPAPPEPPRLQVNPLGGYRVWTVSRHADLLAVLRSPAFRAASVEERIQGIAGRAGRDYGNLLALLRGSLIFQHGALHQDSRARVRRVVEAAMGAWPAARLEAEARRIVAALPDRPGETEVVATLAEPLPGRLVADLLGLPPALCLALQQQALAVSRSWLDAVALRELDRLEALAAALREALREAGSGAAGCAVLASAAPAETADLAAFLLLAGSHSVASTIAAGLDLLARQPALQARLRREPALWPGFLRETLRLAGPIRRLNRRIATAEAEIGGARILPGDLMLLPTDRAHRDPAAFPEPGTPDPARRGAALLAFGGGAHMCQGPLLGTQEAEVMLRAVLERYAPRPAAARGALLAHPDWRSFTHLPLRLEPAGG